MSKKQNNDINNPHDRFFKAVFTRREEAIAFLRGTLPHDIMQKIKPKTIKLANNSYISKDLRETMSDVVYEAEFDGFPVKLAFIIEHKSFVPQFPFLQFLMYFVNCINEQIKQKKKNESIKLALPIIIVLYHGKDNWEIKQIWEYFGDVPSELRKFIPIFEYLMVNLQKDSYIKIKERFDSLILNISLMTLKGAFDNEGYEKSLEIVFDGVSQLFITEHKHKFFDTLLKYIFNRLQVSTEKLYDIIHTQTKKGGEMIMTIATKLRQEGRQEGIQKGRQEGIEEGILKANKLSALNCIKQGFETKTIEIITTLSESEINKLRIAWNENGEKLIEEIKNM